MGVSIARIAAAVLVMVVLAGPGSARSSVRHRLGADERQAGRLSGALAALGRRLAGDAVEPEDEVLAGSATFVLVAAAVTLGAVGALASLSAVVVAVVLRRRSRRRERNLLVERGLPEVIDLLSLVVGAGRPVALAFADICPRVPEPFRGEFTRTLRRTAAGEPFVESVRRLREPLGPRVDAVIHAVTAAEIDGVPLQPALVRAGDEAHRRRRVRAEEAARRVPVAMLFPLVFCILPAFCLLTVVPLLVGSLADLQFPD